jgi:6,7-dimethyl-8-ribityllumazine synthase
MLTKVKHGRQKKTDDSFAIVASRYNGLYVDAMLRAARQELLNAGAKVRIIRVPGAFEVPTVAARLAEKLSAHSPQFSARTSPLSGIICLGVIFQGETSHAQHISWGVTHALAQIQVQYKIPVIHGVFVFEKEKQAKVRCLGTKHNRGTEAAQTALQMAQVMAGLR